MSAELTKVLQTPPTPQFKAPLPLTTNGLNGLKFYISTKRLSGNVALFSPQYFPSIPPERQQIHTITSAPLSVLGYGYRCCTALNRRGPEGAVLAATQNEFVRLQPAKLAYWRQVFRMINVGNRVAGNSMFRGESNF